MIQDQDPDPAGRMSSDDAVRLAVKALQEASSIIPATAREEDLSDDDDDDAQTAAPAFIKKLKDLVDDTDIDSAVWSTDGTSFVIHEPKRLSDQLVKYFKSSKLKSFVRQLHFYGFKKIGGSRYVDWVYNHKYFQRDGRLLHKLRRKTCGPDQQIKNLQTKVDNLQGSLVETQQKLGDMAVALMTLMQHHNAGAFLGSHERAATTSQDVVPAKRARPSPTTVQAVANNLNTRATTITRYEQRQQQPTTFQTYGGGGGGVKQEARRLPAPIGYNEMLSNSIGAMGAMAMTPNTEFEFGAEFDDLFTPVDQQQQEFGLFKDIETRITNAQGGHMAIGVTA